MSELESCVVLVIGVVLIIAGFLGVRGTMNNKYRSKKSYFFVGFVIVLGLLMIVCSMINMYVTPDSEDNIREVLEDNVEKTIQVYEGGTIYLEIEGVSHVDLANSDVVIFTTTDGLRHAIRPGDDMVVVTEAK